jgi:hypothetical protein
MSLSFVIVLAAGIGVQGLAPQSGIELVQSTNPALAPQARPGRSYADPGQSGPGAHSGPLLSTPGYTPRGSSGSSPRRVRPGPPTATDCADGYSKGSGLTRQEFNRLCGQRR